MDSTTPDATTSPGDTTARARLFGGNRMKLGVMAFTAGRTARFNSIDFDVERPYDGRPFDDFILDNPLKLRRRGIALQETTQAVYDFARLGECLSNSGPQNCVRKARPVGNLSPAPLATDASLRELRSVGPSYQARICPQRFWATKMVGQPARDARILCANV
jgi:hypothetical protein